MKTPPRNSRRGMTLILVIVLLAVLVISVSALILHLLGAMRETQRDIAAAQTFQVAEAGLHHAMAELTKDAKYRGENAVAFASGRFDVEISEAGGDKQIRATGHWRGGSREFSQTIVAEVALREGVVKVIEWKQGRLETKAR